MTIPTLSVVAVLLICVAVAQQAAIQNRFAQRLGSVSGGIILRDIGESGGLSCSDLSVIVSPQNNGGWRQEVNATGSFVGGGCSYNVTNLPADEPFVVQLRQSVPGLCEENARETITLKARESLKHNFYLSKRGCSRSE